MVNPWRCGEVEGREWAWKLHTFSPHLVRCFSSICSSWAISFYVFFSSSKLIASEGEGGYGNLWFVAGWSEAQVITWDCEWHLRWVGCGDSLGGLSPGTCGVWCYRLVGGVGIELNYRTLSWHLRYCLSLAWEECLLPHTGIGSRNPKENNNIPVLKRKENIT